jgi:hypothetical protein
MKRTVLIVSGIAVLVAMLGGAAYVAGRMWGTDARADDVLAGMPPVLPSEGETTGATMIAKIESARELPQRPPDTLGVFSRREDNRIFVSSSGQGIMFTLDGGAVGDPDATEVEVVATSETAVYEDVTQESLSAGPQSGETVEQKLEPGQVEEIGESSIVMAWGEKRGDRLVAEVLVYTGPPVIVRSP